MYVTIPQYSYPFLFTPHVRHVDTLTCTRVHSRNTVLARLWFLERVVHSPPRQVFQTVAPRTITLIGGFVCLACGLFCEPCLEIERRGNSD